MPNLSSSAASKHIYDVAAQRPGSVFYVLGESLSGRTHVCERLERLSSRGANWAPRAHLYTCKPSDLGHEILTESLKEILKKAGWRRKAADAIKDDWPRLVKWVGSALGRLFPAIPKELDGVIEQLTNFVKNGGDKDLTSFPQTDVNKIIAILQKILSKTKGDGILIIVDDIEYLSAPGLQLLGALLQSPCDGLTVVITANTDSSSLHQKGHRYLQALLQKKSPETVITLVGHSPEEIMAWKLEQSGLVLTQAEAERAFTCSEGGRSGLLAKWVSDATSGTEKIEIESAKLYGQLELEFNAFDSKTQRAVELLTRAYPEYIPLDMLADAIQLPRDEVIGLSDRLGSGFSKASTAGLALKRFSVFKYVFSRLGPAVLAPSSARAEVSQSPHIEHIGKIMIAPSVEQRLEVISQYLRRGAVEQAHEHIDAALLLHKNSSPQNRVGLLRKLAEVHEQQGEYEIALKHLNDAASIAEDPSERCSIEVELAENHFRLGHTSQSLKGFNRARKTSAALGFKDVWFKAMLRSVSVSVERDKPSAAIKLVRATLEHCAVAEPTPRLKCHLHRTAARAMVLCEPLRGNAQEMAKGALQIATEELDESRAVGNSHYALADVWRHSEYFELARNQYSAALAYSGANFDLRVYCHLGLAATAMTCGDDNALRAATDELMILPIEAQSPEHKALTVFCQFLNCVSGSRFGQKAQSFVEISVGRRWQRQLTAEIAAFQTHRSMEQLRTNVRNIQIVL